MREQRSADVLFVEDEQWARRLVRLAFDELAVPARLHTVPDGRSAVSFLAECTSAGDRPDVDLVLLDLGLPDRHGTTLLEDITSEFDLEAVPIIVFSGSTDRRDVTASYERGADDYVTKPADYEEVLAKVERLIADWLAPESVRQPAV